MEVIFFISVTLLVLVLLNYLIFKFSVHSKKKRIAGGLVILLLVPAAFIASMAILGPMDPGGFGAAAVSLINSALFLLNGLVVVAIGAFQ